MQHKLLLISLSITSFLFSCKKNNYYPKPTAYSRIDLPEHTYAPIVAELPYRFEIAETAILRKDTAWNAKEYWTEIYYPEHEASVQLTYYDLKNDLKFTQELFKDAYTLTSKHQVKASAINETLIRTKNGKMALIAELEGDVPTPFQFVITDTLNNFLRGALYFRTATKNDSLAPVIDYIKEDLVHLLNTTEWKTEGKYPSSK